ncbi:LacI family DNA-binding transcriptional regulator [Pseudophaeobacter sp.]|uniref:LacI family DNA-binding transcriptional regulator n=1 Tax=Pseudophaeobacter sp. TaxID=1971739 RepID=UPI00329691CB
MARVTIKTIAQDLGVSHMTVSRALSDNPNVQKETREAVHKRARELGYVKSSVAMVLRGDSPRIAGLLLPNIVNEFYARFANEMALACEAQSWQLIIHLTNDDPKAEQKALDRLREVQATSVVMVPAPGGAKEPLASSASMQVIELIRQSSPDSGNPAILVEDRSAIHAAVQHLADAGHRQVAYIGADSNLTSGQGRLQAFCDGTKAAGFPASLDLICTGAPSFDMGRRHAQRILAQGQATALVCGGFEISNGALSAIMDAKAEQGDGIAFVGYGDPSFYAWLDRGLTTIQVPVTQLAQRAAEMVTSTHRSDESKQSSFLAQLIIR